MQSQLKTVHGNNKGKSSTKVSTAMDELQYLMDFNAGISQAAAKTMEHLSEFVFISMANLILTRRDSYLTHEWLPSDRLQFTFLPSFQTT